MPFGAECRPDGVRFGLWAPIAKRVEVCLQAPVAEVALPMRPEPDGWFELVTDQAAPGTRYKFHIDGGAKVPDPASRFQPEDVHGPSEVIDPSSFAWDDQSWRGRPWEQAVIYEVHIGTFSPEGTFAGLERRLNHIASLGATAVELMPVSDFPGTRNWGYDGVLPFAPDSSYGRPEDLKRLVQAAHKMNLMVFLDVVYNHFGPEGNYLRQYAPQFFTARHHTPWGEAINFDQPGSQVVRDFFIHNALYWLTEYAFDGLRFDAVHAIVDESNPPILVELAEKVRATVDSGRRVHLVLENDDNAARYLKRDERQRPVLYDAQWSDDFHHALHVALTGETDGYYADYADHTLERLGRCLAEGCAYQGEPSPFRRGRARGEPSRHLPSSAFVSFLQNHDQVGNRAFGERITSLADARAVEAAAAILLLAPSPPLLFMGEEFAAATPFLFFCDFGPELAAQVARGRREEFARFSRFRDPAVRAQIPDPNAPETFLRSRLPWGTVSNPPNRECLALYRELLSIRQSCILPLLPLIKPGESNFSVRDGSALSVTWPLTSGGEIRLLANLSAQAVEAIPLEGDLLYATTLDRAGSGQHSLPPWTVRWAVKR
jgi:malto-oligosyltrehalose trehalohydrolase